MQYTSLNVDSKENVAYVNALLATIDDADKRLRPSVEKLIELLQAVPKPPDFDELHIDQHYERQLTHSRNFVGYHVVVPGYTTVRWDLIAVNSKTLSRMTIPVCFHNAWWLNKASATASGATVPTPVPTKAPTREHMIESRIITIMEATAKRNAALQMPAMHTCTEMRNLLMPQTPSDYVPNSVAFRKSAMQPTTGNARFEFSIDFTDPLHGTVKTITHPTDDKWWEAEHARIMNPSNVGAPPARSEGVALRMMQKIIEDNAKKRHDITKTCNHIDTSARGTLPTGYTVQSVGWIYRTFTPVYSHHGLTLGFSDSAFVVEGLDDTGSPFLLGCKAPQAWWEAENVRHQGVIPAAADLRAVMEHVRDECDTQGKKASETCVTMMDYLTHAMKNYSATMAVSSVLFQDIGSPGSPDLAFIATVSSLLALSSAPVVISVAATGNWWTWCHQQMIGSFVMTTGNISTNPAPSSNPNPSPWFAPAGLSKGLLNSTKAVADVNEVAAPEPMKVTVTLLREMVTDELEQCERDGEDRPNTRIRVERVVKDVLTPKHSLEWVSIDRDPADRKAFVFKLGVLDHTNSAADESGEGIMLSITLPLKPWWS